MVTNKGRVSVKVCQWSPAGETDTNSECAECDGRALSGDLLGVSRSVERDLLSVLSDPGFLFSFYCTISSFIWDVLLCSLIVLYLACVLVLVCVM